MTLEQQRIQLLEHRCTLLRSISEYKLEHSANKGEEAILKQCLATLIQDREYCCLWVARRDSKNSQLSADHAASRGDLSEEESLALIRESLGLDQESNNALQALNNGKPVITNQLTASAAPKSLAPLIEKTGTRSSISWPLLYSSHEYGVLTIHSTNPQGFQGPELDFIANVIADISLALHVDQTSQRLRTERDFNSEIIDTVQALLVSLSPCGNILTFNQRAQEISGYSEQEVKGKYWVDVLIAPEIRIKKQAEFSGLLQKNGPDMNFQTALQTKRGRNRIINWHGSFQPQFSQGKIGLVLFGIDVTSSMKADQERANALAKWNNIFSAMQDPALVVAEDGLILDINPATAVSAKKSRSEIIGRGVCEILHGGRSPGATCPLETILKDKTKRVFETELRGLQGNYMMTISPLKKYRGKSGVTLLMARDLTEEQLMKAEALRAAQLASVGELAAGVAHEINNPINGIINYAQILKDTLSDQEPRRFLDRIIKEGKRIAGITKNLLDFSRKREEAPEPVQVVQLLRHCIELIDHQFALDGIKIEQNYEQKLPEIICNPQQMQQVFLNIFSNARYAVNQRHSNGEGSEKKLAITAGPSWIKGREYVKIGITDNGTGIEHEIIDRVMDPFFSTKTSGEGTGLGLSISQSLVRDNNGIFRIQSVLGRYTTLYINLPTVRSERESHVDSVKN
ncbi:PAS domain S-box protein [Desulfogranum mediterraneum]|uniref:PAS domain S-box protein n=1 Tax=Desulfogranum mediterraneum TaxID=160661 RepID=UPI0004025C0B|nr:PAS domain S-box protein [Desulfogranum mediterraneum]